MWNRGHVGDGEYLHTRCLNGPNSRFSSRTGTFDKNIHFKHSMISRISGGSPTSLPRCERGAPTRPSETDRPAGGPIDDVPLSIRDRHDGIIKRSVNVGLPARHISFDPPSF
jgi:hypothetical protein